MENRIQNAQAEKIEKLVNDLKAVIADGQDLLRSSMGDFRERAASGVQATDRLVHEKPYHSIGIAFGLGLLVGALALSFFAPPGSGSGHDAGGN